MKKTELQNLRAPKMNTPLSSLPNLRPIIKILVVYELELNRKRAESMQHELSRRLGQSFTFSISWWSLKSLGDSGIQKLAASFVADADIVCFSLMAGGELPKCVTKWIEKILLDGKTRKPALLALVESGTSKVPRSSRAETYLNRLSSAAGIDCLCYSDGTPTAMTARIENQEGLSRINAKRAMSAQHRGRQNNRKFSPTAFPSS
jgi:hypothetical protein